MMSGPFQGDCAQLPSPFCHLGARVYELGGVPASISPHSDLRRPAHRTMRNPCPLLASPLCVASSQGTDWDRRWERRAGERAAGDLGTKCFPGKPRSAEV